MGAFNGYTIHACPTKEVNDTYQYFPTQSAFSFFKGFGINELKQLLIEAESTNSKEIYIPCKDKTSGYIRLQTWYVRALVAEYFKTYTKESE